MDETLIIRGQLVGTGPRARPRSWDNEDCPFNYAFFDQLTGEVWGNRVTVRPVSVWIYLAREYPNLLLPYEEDQLEFPAGYLSFACNHLLQEYEHNGNRNTSGTESPPDGGVGDWEDLLDPNAS